MSQQDVANLLPGPPTLERVLRAAAALDAILIDYPVSRTFTYNPTWRAEERLASMNNGSGDRFDVVFGKEATLVRAFDHESDLSPWIHPNEKLADGILDGLPSELLPWIDDPIFRIEGGPRTNLTFVAWRPQASETWSAGGSLDDGGARELLELPIDASPAGYAKYADNYLERDIDADLVAHFYAGGAATPSVVEQLNTSRSYEQIRVDLEAMEYPLR